MKIKTAGAPRPGTARRTGASKRARAAVVRPYSNAFTPDRLPMATKGDDPKILTKTTRFQGIEVTVYSLDGLIWSTRKDELGEIKERHESGRVTFGDKPSGGSKNAQKGGPGGPKPRHRPPADEPVPTYEDDDGARRRALSDDDDEPPRKAARASRDDDEDDGRDDDGDDDDAEAPRTAARPVPKAGSPAAKSPSAESPAAKSPGAKTAPSTGAPSTGGSRKAPAVRAASSKPPARAAPRPSLASPVPKSSSSKGTAKGPAPKDSASPPPAARAARPGGDPGPTKAKPRKR